jgi:rhodanese-related sulfurtransferase
VQKIDVTTDRAQGKACAGSVYPVFDGTGLDSHAAMNQGENMKSAESTNRVSVWRFLAAGAVVALAGSAWAQSETPTVLPGGKIISVDEARKLSAGKSAFFVDTRSVVNFGKGHVPGAHAIPYKGTSEDVAAFDAGKDQFELAKLPSNKEQAVIFYSDGPSGWKSYKAAVWAVKAGHKNVSYMRSGWTEWQGKGLPVEN